MRVRLAPEGVVSSELRFPDALQPFDLRSFGDIQLLAVGFTRATLV